MVLLNAAAMTAIKTTARVLYFSKLIFHVCFILLSL